MWGWWNLHALVFGLFGRGEKRALRRRVDFVGDDLSGLLHQLCVTVLEAFLGSMFRHCFSFADCGRLVYHHSLVLNNSFGFRYLSLFLNRSLDIDGSGLCNFFRFSHVPEFGNRFLNSHGSVFCYLFGS